MKWKNNARAFTLVEVLAALAILSISLVVLIKSQTQSINNVRRIADYERAVFVTENNLHWTFIDLGMVDDWEEYADQTVEDGPFLCRITIREADHERAGDLEASMLQIQAVTTWQEGRRESSFALETWYLWGAEQ